VIEQFEEVVCISPDRIGVSKNFANEVGGVRYNTPDGKNPNGFIGKGCVFFLALLCWGMSLGSGFQWRSYQEASARFRKTM